MNHFFSDYFWRNGKPYGKGVIDEIQGKSYKVVSDPYFRRFSVEEYHKGKFQRIIYDSASFDFRHLSPLEQTAWHKEILSETADQVVCLIRNGDDRDILKEINFFRER